MIAKRFIANFYPDSTVSSTTVLGSAGDVKFKVTGKQIIDPGWRTVYGNQKLDSDSKDEANTVLPVFQIDEQGPHTPQLREGQTKPPAPYTEATLLRAMETAGKQVDDDELSTLMKENGIGRPSTRAAIIETLFRRKYIIKEKKNLQPTVNGIRLIDTISSPMLKSVELTGRWEKKLREIEKGVFSTAQFIEEMRQMVTEVVHSVISDNNTARFTPIADPQPKEGSATKQPSPSEKKPSKKPTSQKEMLCPKCGKPILKGKSAWGCSAFREGCNFRLPFEAFGKKLSDAQATALLSKGETSLIKGLIVNNIPQDGKLAFDANFSLIIKTSEAKKTDLKSLKCPVCGGNIIEGRTAWGCSNYKNGCQFLVPFVFMSKKLTPTHLSVLLKKGRTGVISGFIDNNGIPRNGALILSENNNIILEEKSA